MVIGVSLAAAIVIAQLCYAITRQLASDANLYVLPVNVGVFVVVFLACMTFSIRLIYRTSLSRSLASAAATLRLLLGVASLVM